MGDDLKDIWNHFLKISKQDTEEQDCKEETFDKEDSGKNFFVENFEKYLDISFKKEKMVITEKKSDSTKKSKSKFKKIGSEIDLHGKTVIEALKLLENFIIRSRARGLTHVLVIVGKGLHSEDGVSVLRQAVIDWLETKGKSLISFYEFAPSKLGGSGALIIKMNK